MTAAIDEQNVPIDRKISVEEKWHIVLTRKPLSSDTQTPIQERLAIVANAGQLQSIVYSQGTVNVLAL